MLNWWAVALSWNVTYMSFIWMNQKISPIIFHLAVPDLLVCLLGIPEV